jgi:hypothetical protein
MKDENVKNVNVFYCPVGQVGGHIGTMYIGCNFMSNSSSADADASDDEERDNASTVAKHQNEDDFQWAEVVEDDAQPATTPVDGNILHALGVLRAERLLKFAYDYAWVMLVMNQSADMPHFVTTQSFLDYLSGALGLGGLPSESTISKKTRDTRGRHPAWTFADTDDATEVRRRNNVANRFMSAMRKG